MALRTLAVAVLGLLVERSMHPYEMFQLLVTRGDVQRVEVRPGTLYRTVDRRQQQGPVRAIGTARSGVSRLRAEEQLARDALARTAGR